MADDDEADDHLDDLPTLRSQRRFLEVMSLVSAFYYWFDVRINTEGSLLGQSVHIGSTRYAVTALWIGLIWAAVRYGQHLHRARRDIGRDLREDFNLELTRLANGVVRRHLARMTLADRRAFGNEKGKAHFKGRVYLERFNFERARRFDGAHKEVAAKLPSGPLGKDSHSVIHTEFDWLSDDAGSVIDFELGIARFQTVWLWGRAAIAATFRRPAVFDYATPAVMFLFAALSLVLAIVHPSAPPTG